MSFENQSGQRKRRLNNLASGLLYFAGLFAVAFVFAQLTPSPSAAPTTTTTIPEAAGADITTTAPTLPVQDPGVIGDEPVADAAEIILPSVVHIQTASGVGSGVVYDSDGLVITAAHVVGDNSQVTVRFNDGQRAVGEVLGTAPDVDVAVVQVDRTGLDPAVFSLEKPRVGQLAVAVGSPWGLASTVTSGIISAVDQTNCPEFNICASMVQTDAAINPGNSGGALINRQGEVVGINVSIFTLSGASDGVGFAVPSNTVVAYADAIITGEPLETAFLGVGIDNATGGRAGALITSITSGSGADNSELEVGDIVVALEGVPVLSSADLIAQVRNHRPGSTVDLLVLRDDDELMVTVTLGIREENL